MLSIGGMCVLLPENPHKSQGISFPYFPPCCNPLSLKTKNSKLARLLFLVLSCTPYFRTNYIRVPSFICSNIFKKMLGYLLYMHIYIHVYIHGDMVMCRWVQCPQWLGEVRSQWAGLTGHWEQPEMSAGNWTTDQLSWGTGTDRTGSQE